MCCTDACSSGLSAVGEWYCFISVTVLVLFMLAHCRDLLGHLNRMEPLLTLLVTPVL